MLLVPKATPSSDGSPSGRPPCNPNEPSNSQSQSNSSQVSRFGGGVGRGGKVGMGTEGASWVVPGGVYLASEREAARRDLLIELNVSHVVNAAASQAACHFEADKDFTYFKMDLFDDKDEDVLQFFEPCWEFMDEAVNNDQAVLVHCKSGNSRGAMVCLGYLMHRFGWSVQKAYQYLKIRRPSVRPNDGYLKQLLMYQHQLEEQDEESSEDEAEAEPEPGGIAHRIRQMATGDGGEDIDSESEEEFHQGDIEIEDDDQPSAVKAMDLVKGNGNGEDGQSKTNDKGKEKDEVARVDEVAESKEDELKRRLAAERWKRLLQRPQPLTQCVLANEAGNRDIGSRILRLMEANEWEEVGRMYGTLHNIADFQNIVRRSLYLYLKAATVPHAQHIIKRHDDPQEAVRAAAQWMTETEDLISRYLDSSPSKGFLRAFEQAMPAFAGLFAKQLALTIDAKIRQAFESQSSTANGEDEGDWNSNRVTLPHVVDESADRLLRSLNVESLQVFELNYALALAGRLLRILLALRAGEEAIGKFTHERDALEQLQRALLLDGEADGAGGSRRMSESLRREVIRMLGGLTALVKDASSSVQPATKTSADPLSLHVIALCASRWPRRCWLPSSKSSGSDWRGLPRSEWPGGYVLPADVSTSWNEFAAGYTNTYRDRRIHYVPHLGLAEVKVQLNGRNYLVTVTTAMMCVLNRYNYFSECTLSQLAADTSIPEPELKKALVGLCAKVVGPGSTGGLLVRVKANDATSGEDVFKLNEKFVSRRAKFRVMPGVRKKVTPCSTSITDSASTAS